MKLASIEVSNFRGLDHILIKPKSITILSGQNGSGKSSLIEAIRSIFNGGHTPSNIRLGEKKAVIELILDSGITIKKTITEKTSTLTVTDKEGRELDGETPKVFVEKLATGYAYDALGLLTAKPKDRAAFILESMPITFQVSEISSLTVASDGGKPSKTLGQVTTLPAGVVDLDGFDKIYTQVYEARRVANVAQKEAESTVNLLAKGLPTQDEKDWAAGLSRLQTVQDGARKEVQEAEAAAEKSSVAQEHAIIAEINAKIQALTEERASRLAVVKQNLAAKLKQIKEITQPDMDKLTGEIATARERASAQERAAGVRESYETAKKRSREHVQKSMQLDAGVKALDALKKKKLSEQPIEGIEFRDGEVYVDGIAFDMLNTARQYLVAFTVAALKSGELGLMVADKCEALEAETTWKEFLEGAKDSGFQVICSRVSVGPLTVATL